MIRAKCCATFNLLPRGPMRVASQPVRVGPTEALPSRRELLHDEMHDKPHDELHDELHDARPPCPVLATARVDGWRCARVPPDA